MDTQKYLQKVEKLENMVFLEQNMTIADAAKKLRVNNSTIQQMIEDSDVLMENIGIFCNGGIAEDPFVGQHTIENLA